jgi:DNA polymerase (family 10)
VGPQTIKTLWKELGIKDLDTLEKAARAGKIRTLPGFGERSEQKILKGLEFLRHAGGRAILGFVFPDLEHLEQRLREFPEVERVAIAGSVRRRKETIGDIDILVVSSAPEKVMERFVKLPAVAHVYGQGPTKTNVRLSNNLDADLRVVAAGSWGAALCYFTGSKAHNITLRNIAIQKGWKLNEYGLFEGERQIAGGTEEEIYEKLGLQYIEPELREDRGEIEAARKRRLPTLIGYDDLQGDLQIQTHWTDGKHSIEEMALAAQRFGLEYIAITDHTKALPMAHGADEAQLIRQMEAIDQVNEKLKSRDKRLTVLKGAEVNIMKDGTLDINDRVLEQLDVVGAAVHSHFDLSQKAQTERLIRALENPHVDIIFHLTTRLINRRKPIDLDIDAIIEAAKLTGTVLEIDAYPDRLDISEEIVKRCIEAGGKMSIDSDAHAAAHLSYLPFGIAQARRGWAERKDIINCWSLEKMLACLKRQITA